MFIKKSEGNNATEKTLFQLCEKTFLKLWAYPNLYKKQGDELCDLLAIFENHIFIFQAKQIKFNEKTDFQVAWERWKRKAISAQIDQLKRAKNWILQNPYKIFLDPKCQTRLPIEIAGKEFIIHQIIVAYGAYDACKNFSDDNVYGSLAISYKDAISGDSPFPFVLNLDRAEGIHVFDSHNLEIVLSELDTFYDFTAYILAKEEAIKRYDCLAYCGEEDLLAHYFLNFDDSQNKYFIGTKDKSINALYIGEGEWKDFVESSPYKRRKEANSIFYLWDELIQRTCDNALKGVLLGNGDIFAGQSALHEMAKEPRFSRRELSSFMIKAIQNFPENIPGVARNLSFMPSFYKEKGYVFLQVKYPNIVDYDNDYRPKRQAMLQLACGAAKNKFPHLKKIIGIAIDAPKFSKRNSEDFVLMDCEEWSEEQRAHYEQANEEVGFFKSAPLKMTMKKASDFPVAGDARIKVGRNEQCPCRSGKKFKKCCGR